MLAPLRRPSYRYLWLASALSQIGSEISRVGVLLFLFREEDDISVLAGYVLSRILPGILLSPVAGSIIDHYNKRNVMIVADLGRLICVGGMLAVPSIPVIYTLSLLIAIGTLLFEPAKLAAIPNLVPAHELTQANAADRSAGAAVFVVGPIVGATLFTSGGLAATLVVDAATFALSAALIALVYIPPDPSRNPESILSRFSGIFDGLRYIARDPLVSYLVGFAFVSVLCVGVWTPLAPFFIQNFLDAPSESLGLALAAFGLGSIAGGLVGPVLAECAGKGVVVFSALVVESITMIVYSFIPDLWASLAILFVWGSVVSVMMISHHAILQQVLPRKLLGRIFAGLRQVEDAAMLLALALVIALHDRLAANEAFTLLGALYLLIVIVSARTKGARQLRQRLYSRRQLR